MTVAFGSLQYNLGNSPVTGMGLSWDERELDNAIENSIVDRVNDVEGRHNLQSLLEGIADTEFQAEGIKEFLKDNHILEDWRIGEAIAESYLTHHYKCNFPWHISRDEKKAGSSLPGADLVGFCEENGKIYFVLGEVKTSMHDQYPPGVVYGRSGIDQQIEDLCDKRIVQDLIKYLGHRSLNASWANSFQAAFKEYLNSNIRLFGFLVRDVAPHQNDLKNRVNNAGKICPIGTEIRFLAVYLPLKSIVSLSKRVLTHKEKDSTI